MDYTFAQLKQLKKKYEHNKTIYSWLCKIEKMKLDGCRFNTPLRMS